MTHFSWIFYSKIRLDARATSKLSLIFLKSKYERLVYCQYTKRRPFVREREKKKHRNKNFVFALNVRPRCPYIVSMYTDLFIFRFVFEHCLRSTLRLYFLNVCYCESDFTLDICVSPSRYSSSLQLAKNIVQLQGKSVRGNYIYFFL